MDPPQIAHPDRPSACTYQGKLWSYTLQTLRLMCQSFKRDDKIVGCAKAILHDCDETLVDTDIGTLCNDASYESRLHHWHVSVVRALSKAWYQQTRSGEVHELRDGLDELCRIFIEARQSACNESLLTSDESAFNLDETKLRPFVPLPVPSTSAEALSTAEIEAVSEGVEDIMTVVDQLKKQKLTWAQILVYYQKRVEQSKTPTLDALRSSYYRWLKKQQHTAAPKSLNQANQEPVPPLHKQSRKALGSPNANNHPASTRLDPFKDVHGDIGVGNHAQPQAAHSNQHESTKSATTGKVAANNTNKAATRLKAGPITRKHQDHNIDASGPTQLDVQKKQSSASAKRKAPAQSTRGSAKKARTVAPTSNQASPQSGTQQKPSAVSTPRGMFLDIDSSGTSYQASPQSGTQQRPSVVSTRRGTFIDLNVGGNDNDSLSDSDESL